MASRKFPHPPPGEQRDPNVAGQDSYPRDPLAKPLPPPAPPRALPEPDDTELREIRIAVDMMGDDLERIADALEALVVVQASGLSLPSQRERAVEMVMRVATRFKKP